MRVPKMVAQVAILISWTMSIPIMGQESSEALESLKKAAQQGDRNAQFNLGLMYDDGEGVPLDDLEAVKWYRMAAEQGNSEAQNDLGVIYSKGEGTTQDYIHAYMWFDISSALSKDATGKIARQNRNTIARKMTSEQIATAQRLAKEWMEKRDKQ